MREGERPRQGGEYLNARKTACTTIPVSFTPRDVGPPPDKDAKAFRGYYIILGDKGYEFVQDIGDEFYFTPTHAALVAERCAHCGVVEFDFDKFVGNPHDKLHKLATVDLNGSEQEQRSSELITVALPVHRLRVDGDGRSGDQGSVRAAADRRHRAHRVIDGARARAGSSVVAAVARAAAAARADPVGQLLGERRRPASRAW